MPFLCPKNDKVFLNFFFLLKKIIPQYIKNYPKKIITCRKNLKKKILTIFFYSVKKKILPNFFLVNFLTC